MRVDDNSETSDHCKTSIDDEEERVRQLADEHDRPRGQELCKCTICAKHFGNRRILQLHLQMHQANDKILHKCDTRNNQRIPCRNEEPPATESLMEIQPQIITNTSREQRLFQCSAAAKKVGLTKMRLEDCFRCDACSCIYLEEGDYRKHMRNFHKESLQKQKQRKACKSCCKHCNCKGNHHHPTEPNTTSSNNLHFNIKDRWRKIVSARMDPTKTPVSIQTVPGLEDCDDVLDYSHLLSQVEVRIKTEPEDDTTDN